MLIGVYNVGWKEKICELSDGEQHRPPSLTHAGPFASIEHHLYSGCSRFRRKSSGIAVEGWLSGQTRMLRRLVQPTTLRRSRLLRASTTVLFRLLQRLELSFHGCYFALGSLRPLTLLDQAQCSGRLIRRGIICTTAAISLCRPDRSWTACTLTCLVVLVCEPHMQVPASLEGFAVRCHLCS